MLSYQTLTVNGLIHSLGKGYDLQKTAQLKVDGLTQFLIIPLDDSRRYDVGDIVQVKVFIDKISNLSRTTQA